MGENLPEACLGIEHTAISSLRLYHYRNIQDCELEFSPGLTCFLGNNGQGKTNLLEALSILSILKSFRGSKRSELIGWSHTEASVTGEILRYYDSDSKHNATPENICVALQAHGMTPYINGEKVLSISSFLGRLRSISFTPNDLSLIRGAPEQRRKLIDKFIIDLVPTHFDDLMQYNRALKSKNTLLRTLNESEAANQVPAWNKLLAKYGSNIATRRLDMAVILADVIEEHYGKFGKESIKVELHSDFLVSNTALSEMEIYELLQSFLGKEIAQHRCLKGAQKDDLIISIDNHSARQYASQGQARSLVLALKLAFLSMAEHRLNQRFIVLLDDVDSELDPHRVRGLFESIFQVERQVFITGVALSPVVKTEQISTIFKVEGGRIFN